MSQFESFVLLATSRVMRSQPGGVAQHAQIPFIACAVCFVVDVWVTHTTNRIHLDCRVAIAKLHTALAGFLLKFQLFRGARQC